jgi:hypothetical protein
MNNLEKKIFEILTDGFDYNSIHPDHLNGWSEDINLSKAVSQFLLEKIKEAMVYARLKDSKSLDETIDDYLKSKYNIQ